MYENPLITLVIPVRLSKDNLYDEVERIDRILETMPAEGFEALIVDYGSCEERRRELTDAGSRHSVRVIRVDSEDQVFSVGKARDIGTQHARTPLVFYHDIDFLMSRENYKRILLEARVRNMPENIHTFFILPGAYLTEEFSRKYVAISGKGDGELADHILHDAIMRLDHSVYSGMTYAISALVANRLHLLAIGGHDPQFVGHGAEDFELFHRLASYYQKGPRTRDYYANTVGSNSIQSYTGFRAYFALYGIDVFQRGLILAHLYHPRRPDPAYAVTTNNSRVGEVMRAYDTGATSLPPLPDLTVTESTLFLAEEFSAQWQALRQVIPLLGKCSFHSADEFSSPGDFGNFIIAGNFTRVFFPLENSANAHSTFHEAARGCGCGIITFRKGTSANSWLFDHGDPSSVRDHSHGELKSHPPTETLVKGPAGRIDFTEIRGILPDPVISRYDPTSVSTHAPLFYSFGGVQAVTAIPVSEDPDPAKLIHDGYQAYHAGRFQECVDLLGKTLTSTPPDASLLRAVAEAYLSLGDEGAALAALESARKLAPGNKNLKRRIIAIRVPKWCRRVMRSKPFPIPPVE